MEDKGYFINRMIYEYHIEMIYWENCILGLNQFLFYEKITKTERLKIEKEILRLEFHKYKIEVKFKEYIISHKFTREFNNKH
jgi:hypothetical protein